MSEVRVAVPSIRPGGLTAKRSGHFGRCDVFTLVDVKDSEILNTQVIKNVEHSEGGCLIPVKMLAEYGVNAIVVSGMGMRPLAGFREAGIEVLIGCGTTVQEAIDGFISGRLESMSEQDTCDWSLK
ncbi:MAG: NifB/NifX family molybdenum-iron cluster-binding protein [Zhaonellaceae bacterium]|jgi:predicted Fe-Mo cluster-binding NifX family protein|nr:dinitrogenase iron-molybdenum cofactor biosynthesis protein [Clostridia bacterium]